jgi:hypothetical protein
MEKKQLKPKQVSSVLCPLCGAAVGKPCRIYSGQKRNEPHVERKLSAIQAVEKKRMR